MKKIKIAQIGINKYSHSNEVFESLIKQTDLFEFVGFVFPEGEKERISNKYEKVKHYPELTLNEVLNNQEIEAVAIETDEIYLSKYAIMAAKAGKHIHLEKPGGVNLAEFEALISIMKNSGKVLHLGYMYRYNPYIIELLESVKNGEIGEVLSVEAQMNCHHPEPLRNWLKNFKGGMMFYLGCHLIDLILQIKGQPKKIIPLNKSSGLETNAEDFGMAVFEYENGISFAKANATEVGGYARRQLVVAGSRKTIELKPLEMFTEGGHYTEKTEYGEVSWGNMGEHGKTPIFNRYDGMMAAFHSYIKKNKNPYSLEYELELFKTILKTCGGYYESDSNK